MTTRRRARQCCRRWRPRCPRGKQNTSWFSRTSPTRLVPARRYLYPMLLRRVAFPDFCEPCLPSPAEQPPAGAGWLHEIKHDGFRMLVRRNGAGVRLFTRNGHDWTGRYPAIAAAAAKLSCRSCLIDGEAVACDDNGVPIFDRLRYRRVFLYAFDLIELDGEDLRREPIERRKAALAKLLRHAKSGLLLNEHIEYDDAEM